MNALARSIVNAKLSPADWPAVRDMLDAFASLKITVDDDVVQVRCCARMDIYSIQVFIFCDGWLCRRVHPDGFDCCRCALHARPTCNMHSMHCSPLFFQRTLLPLLP